MHAVEGEAGQVVVEADLVIPAFIAVAAITVPAQFAAVHIIRLVTGNTLANRCSFFDSCCMAGITTGFDVRSAQRKVSILIMVKVRFSPTSVVVALLTALAITTFVRIIGTVTADTAGWRLCGIFTRGMA